MADAIYGMAGLRASSVTADAPGSLDLVAAFDRLAAANRAERAERIAAEETARSHAPVAAAPAPRRKRRTQAEMQEFRADKARQIADSYHSLVPAETRAWLDEPDPLLTQILEGQRESDT